MLVFFRGIKPSFPSYPVEPFPGFFWKTIEIFIISQQWFRDLNIYKDQRIYPASNIVLQNYHARVEH
jgi:hypothetical protein